MKWRGGEWMDEVLDGDEACGGVDIPWNHTGTEGKK